MEPSEAIKVIREFQAWRRGGDDPMPYPRTTGQALDAICYHAERMEAEIAVWKHESKRLDEQLKAMEETAIEWRCEYQDLKDKARQS